MPDAKISAGKVSTVFLAVATGHNQANLPPILTLGNPGDQVVWLESQLAQKRNFSLGSSQLLEKRGFSCKSVAFAEEEWWSPDEFAGRLLQEAAKQPDCDRIVVVLNGGQKLNLIAIEKFRAIAAKSGLRVDLAYGELRPASILELQGAGRFIPQAIRNSLTISEWLLLNGWRSEAAGELPNECLLYSAIRVADGPPHAATPPQLAEAYERYWMDEDFARLVTRWRYRREFAPANDGGALLSVQRVQEDESLSNQWNVRVRRAVRHMPRNLGLNEAQMKWLADTRRPFLGECVGFIREAREAIARTAREEAPGVWTEQEVQELRAAGLVTGGVDTAEAFGPWFERAVQWRVLRWLQSRPPALGVISEIGVNLELPKKAGEFDLLILLKNAVAIHLECKTSADRGRLQSAESQTMKLHAVAGAVAEQYLVYPGHHECLPGEVDNSPFAKQQQDMNDFELLKRWRTSITLLPFTLDRPGHTLETFEQQLDRIFARFVTQTPTT